MKEFVVVATDGGIICSRQEREKKRKKNVDSLKLVVLLSLDLFDFVININFHAFGARHRRCDAIKYN